MRRQGFSKPHWSGLANRQTDTYDHTTNARPRSSQVGQKTEWQQLLPRNRREAQLLRIDPSGEQRGSASEPVRLPDWKDWLVDYHHAWDVRTRKRLRQER